MKRIVLASDHAGINLKNQVVKYLAGLNYQTVDVGTYDNKSCHYPEFAEKLTKTITPTDKGLLICGSGIGINIAGIKCGLRCSLAFNEYTAKECRKQGMQVMAMGDRVVSVEIARKMVQEFLKDY